jgi:hypothetical protein
MMLPPKSQENSSPIFFAYDSIADCLSRERLSKYMTRTAGSTERALSLYVWNQEAGAALTVTLSQLEVCLRNQVARALSNAYGPLWPQVAKLRHNHEAVRLELEKAESRINKPVPSTDDIIAATDFNLWRELCKPAYAGVFWAKRIPLAFPHVTAPGKEREILTIIHRKVDLLLKLRNRIAHHEPIIGSNWEKIGAKLAVRHADAIELLQWMNSDFATWVLSRDTFETVALACPI